VFKTKVDVNDNFCRFGLTAFLANLEITIKSIMSKPFDKSKNAYLVLAHEDVKMLNILVARLVQTGVVYIHLDKSSRIKSPEVTLLDGVKLYREYKVKWGGWSIVEATKFLADKAIADGADRLTLLSGNAYPIVSDKVLIEHATANLDIFNAGEVDLQIIDKNFQRRFTSRHLEFKLGNSLYARIVRRLSREFFCLFSHLHPVSLLFPLKLTLGSQWWSITSRTYSAGLALSNKEIESYFKKIECSDESYFGTLFLSVSNSHQNRGTTYVNWGTQGRPNVLNNLNLLKNQDYLFARKFSSDGFSLIEGKLSQINS